MSDLLNSASLVMIPSGYAEDKVYSVVPSDGSGDLSFTRASNGTRINSAGLVEVCPWNLLEQSQSFSTSGGAWNYTAGSGVTTGQTGYDGTSNAVLFTDSGANAVYGAYQSFSKLGAVTLSIYAKAGSTNILNIDIFQIPLATVRVNLSTGAITSGSGVVESVGNGWYRISVTAVMTDSYYVRFGCPATGTVYIQNIQANIGSTAKPYFPTTDRLNVPRLTYQNGGGGCPSLLLEKQSTNETWYSEDFSQSYWTKQGLTVTANSIVSPDGTQNADLFTLSTSLAEHNVYAPAAGLPITSNAPFTFSCYVKKGTGRYFCTATYFTGVGFGPYATFDLNTATLVASGASFGTYSSSKIENMGNDWYRCSVTGFGPYTSLIFAPDVRSASSLIPGVPFTGASETMYIWGAQFEVSSYPTSYIPTLTTSSATRVADACFKNSISSLIGQSGGVVFADIMPFQFLDGSYIGISDNASAFNRQIFGFEGDSGNTGTLRFYGWYTGGTINCTANQRYKIAMAYANNDFVIYVNGTQVVNQTSGTITGTVSHFGFDSYVATSQNFQGQINQAALFKTRLSNSELASLTTI